MDIGYIVRVIYKDDKPDDEYFHYSYSGAVEHLKSYRNDKSGLIKRIEIIDSHTFHLPYITLEFELTECATEIHN